MTSANFVCARKVITRSTKICRAFGYYERAGKLKKDIIKYDIKYDKSQFRWVKKTAGHCKNKNISQIRHQTHIYFWHATLRNNLSRTNNLLHPDVFGAEN